MMREKVMEILGEIRPDVDFGESTTLLDDGDLESLDVVALVGELNDEFDIKITVKHITADNFNSVDAIIQLIEMLQE